MFVKVCGITNREDALAAAEAGADAIGFNFYRDSPRYVSPTGAAVITAQLPRNTLRVGIFVDETPERIAAISIEAGIDIAQLYGISECPSLRVWRAVAIREATEIATVEGQNAEAFLLDTPSSELLGGTGRTFPWRVAREAAQLTTRKIILAGGLDESNVQQAIEEALPWGVDVCSRIEKEPGRKDHQRMKKFIEAAHAGRPE